MGLNILVERLDGTRHPEWDDGRYAGDREIPTLLSAIPLIDEPDYDPWQKGDAPLLRPADPADLDKVAWPSVNPERWEQLAAILKGEPDYWLYYSV